MDALTQRAAELETSSPPDEALVSWFREGVAFTHTYGGVCALMASAHADPDSALYASSTALHSAGARLLLRAQAEGTARADMDGDDLFALMSGLAWLVGQPAFAPRADHLFHLITSAILTNGLVTKSRRQRVEADPRSDTRSSVVGTYRTLRNTCDTIVRLTPRKRAEWRPTLGLPESRSDW